MNRIIQFKTSGKRKEAVKQNCDCAKPDLEIDTELRTVYCLECGAFWDPLDYLIMLAEYPEKFIVDIAGLVNMKNSLIRQIERLKQQKRDMSQEMNLFQRGNS